MWRYTPALRRIGYKGLASSIYRSINTLQSIPCQLPSLPNTLPDAHFKLGRAGNPYEFKKRNRRLVWDSEAEPPGRLASMPAPMIPGLPATEEPYKYASPINGRRYTGLQPLFFPKFPFPAPQYICQAARKSRKLTDLKSSLISEL